METHRFGAWHPWPVIPLSSSEKEIQDEKAVLQVLSNLKQGEKVKVVGAGFSYFANIPATITIYNYYNNSEQFELIGDGTVKVSARTPLKNLCSFLFKSGRKLPAVQHFKNFSVGGTVSVGGIGADSCEFGTMAQNVVSLEIITVDGEKMLCNEILNSNLFNFSLCGLGRLGIIETVVLKTFGLPNVEKSYEMMFNCLQDMIEFWKQAPQNIDQNFAPSELFGIADLKNKYFKIRIVYPFLTRQDAENHQMHFKGNFLLITKTSSPHLKLPVTNLNSKEYRIFNDFCFSSYNTMIDFYQAIMLDSRVMDLLSVLVVMPIRKVEPRIPLCHANLEAAPNQLLYNIGLFFSFCDTEMHLHIKDIVRMLTKICIELNGRPYQYGFLELEDKDLFKLYGDNYQEFATIKKQMDPKQKLFESPHNRLFS